MVKRGHGTGGNRRDPHRHFLAVLLMVLQDVADASQMGEHTNGGLAVVAEGFDDAIVSNAVRGVGLERSHQLRIYQIRHTRVNSYLHCHNWPICHCISVYTRSRVPTPFLPITYGRIAPLAWETHARRGQTAHLQSLPAKRPFGDQFWPSPGSTGRLSFWPSFRHDCYYYGQIRPRRSPF